MVLLKHLFSNFGNYQQNLSNFDKDLPKIGIFSPGIECRSFIFTNFVEESMKFLENYIFPVTKIACKISRFIKFVRWMGWFWLKIIIILETIDRIWALTTKIGGILSPGIATSDSGIESRRRKTGRSFLPTGITILPLPPLLWLERETLRVYRTW
jgi:hypothetical protein